MYMPLVLYANIFRFDVAEGSFSKVVDGWVLVFEVASYPSSYVKLTVP